MHDTDATIARLSELRELGVLLAVDDFGTGYSSLRYLNNFPVDLLKMARPFVERLDTGTELRALAQTIVDLGANLGLPVIAEGIERPEQVTELGLLGCELGQGFHFGVPAPAAEVESLILAGQLRLRALG
jgi:EAL domain-containing protein (putative c-di-GMP-specific phosphodiesterase class I)